MLAADASDRRCLCHSIKAALASSNGVSRNPMHHVVGTKRPARSGSTANLSSPEEADTPERVVRENPITVPKTSGGGERVELFVDPLPGESVLQVRPIHANSDTIHIHLMLIHANVDSSLPSHEFDPILDKLILADAGANRPVEWQRIRRKRVHASTVTETGSNPRSTEPSPTATPVAAPETKPSRPTSGSAKPSRL